MEQLSGNPLEIYKFCGDGFISEIEYGASLLVSLRFQFLTEKDKEEFNKKVQIEYDGATLKLKGSSDIKSLSERVKETGRVVLEAQQIGGSDSGLLNMVSNKMPSCSLTNIENCLAVMEGVLDYGRDLKKSFDEADADDDIAKHWDVVGYTMTGYKDLRRSGPYNFFNVDLPELSQEFINLRSLLMTEWMYYRKLLNEAEKYEHALGLSENAYDLIQDIQRDLRINVAILEKFRNSATRIALKIVRLSGMYKSSR